jgi:hypothetical protein
MRTNRRYYAYQDHYSQTYSVETVTDTRGQKLLASGLRSDLAASQVARLLDMAYQQGRMDFAREHGLSHLD